MNIALRVASIAGYNLAKILSSNLTIILSLLKTASNRVTFITYPNINDMCINHKLTLEKVLNIKG